MNTFTPHTHQSRHSSHGFTLIETLIAITVLTLSIVGPFQIVQGVLNSAYNSRDQLIGAGLAQEAMEYVREVRDSNYLYNVHGGAVTWMYGFDASGGSSDCYSHGCLVDPGTKFVITCAADNCPSTPPLYQDGTTYLYNNRNVGTPTRFYRQVKMTAISPSETMVTVTVTWENHGTKSVVLQEYLRNWL